MTRTAVTIDRIATAAAGLLLLLVGAAAIVFATDLVTGIPDTVTAPGLTSAVSEPWWPWAVLGVSILLIALALRWLLTHKPAPRVDTVRLDGSTPQGRLTADLGAVANTAADALAATPGIHRAKGRAVRERDRTTLTFTVVVDTPEDIPTIIATTDRLCAQAVTMVGDPNLASRTHLRVPAKRHDRPRVH